MVMGVTKGDRRCLVVIGEADCVPEGLAVEGGDNEPRGAVRVAVL